MSGIAHTAWSNEKGHFRFSCRATEENRFCIGADSGQVTVGQLIYRHGRKELWDSVALYAEEDADGTLTIRVVVFNPDWDEPLQVACVRSRPQDGASSRTSLGCNLDHIKL